MRDRVYVFAPIGAAYCDYSPLPASAIESQQQQPVQQAAAWVEQREKMDFFLAQHDNSCSESRPINFNEQIWKENYSPSTIVIWMQLQFADE